MTSASFSKARWEGNPKDAEHKGGKKGWRDEPFSPIWMSLKIAGDEK